MVSACTHTVFSSVANTQPAYYYSAFLEVTECQNPVVGYWEGRLCSHSTVEATQALASWALAGGRLQSLDWTGGLDWWTGLDWNGLDWNGLDWNGLDSKCPKLYYSF